MREINKIYCDDWLNNGLPDKCAKLIIMDCPYFEVKGDFDFVWKNFDDYLADVEKWAIECKRVLSDNGTLFWWGHALKIAYSQVIIDKYFKLENIIKWRKTDCQTRIGYENFRSFPPVTEHLLMYSQDKINLTGCVDNIRTYIRSEIKGSKGKVLLNQINRVLGTATNGGGVASACLSLNKSEPAMITKELYIKLQEWCYPYMQIEYEELRIEYEELRIEYEELRRPFNNIMKLEDVWDFAQDVHITGDYDHDTQKTERIARVMITTTTREKDLVVIPMSGSGTECAMAAYEGRPFYGFDIKQKYVDMGNNRVKKILKEPQLF